MSLPVLVLSALLAPALAVTLLNLVAAPRLHRVRPARSATGDTGPDPASILVPARDEAANLRRLLPALVATGPEALEILVLDDGSTDETAAVVRHFAARDPRIRLVAGSEPPDGWTGKNWACHQLALQARGDVVIFCDADVRPSPRAVSRTVRAMAESRADALTAIPRHEPGG
ncbi:MAG: glycosyltransferase family 2 protein, partial [Longimicrobiales bacterium]|nr:glycosyltransferase family 2 protein [Longimicrobiales bacterium]